MTKRTPEVRLEAKKAALSRLELTQARLSEKMGKLRLQVRKLEVKIALQTETKPSEPVTENA